MLVEVTVMPLDLGTLCAVAISKHASDVHLTVESQPAFRIHGELVREEGEVLSKTDIEDAFLAICPKDKLEKFKKIGHVDFPYSLPGIGRFRVNAFRQRGSIALTIRVLAFEVPRFDALNLPEAVVDLAKRRYGLVVISGPTGSGKSSTMAALIDLLNQTRSYHIITLEDPIEYLHKHRKSVVNQREVGTDTLSFADGVHAALREDPDVIVIGEMRDFETARTALSAAETGHLVLATMHAARAPQAVSRIVDLFPMDHQTQACTLLSEVIEGVVTQHLLRRQDRSGRVAAFELLLGTPAVREIIRQNRPQDLYAVLNDESKGMMSLEASLERLYKEGVISLQDMRSRVIAPDVR